MIPFAAPLLLAIRDGGNDTTVRYGIAAMSFLLAVLSLRAILRFWRDEPVVLVSSGANDDSSAEGTIIRP